MGEARRGRRPTSRWVDRSIRTKGLVVIAVPIAILVVVLGTTFWFTHVDDQAQNTTSRARQVVDAATTVENSLLDEQSGVSSWLLTGDRVFLSDAARSHGAIPAQLGQLVALSLGTPAAGEARGIDADANRLVFDMAKLRARPPSPLPSGPTRTLLQRSLAATVRLRSDVAGLTRTMNGEVAAQRSAIHTSSVLLPSIAIAAVVLALAGGILVSLLFTKGVVTRLRRLERATVALERGEVPTQVPSGRDEIGRLSSRLLDASSQLREREEERDRARAELDDILTASPVVSLRYDVPGRRLSHASPNIERLLGIPAELALADLGAVVARFHPESAAQLDAMVAGAGGGAQRGEILLRFRRDPDSEDWRQAEAVYSVDAGPDGQPRAVVAYLVDVSDRHLAQRAAEDRRLLLESIFHASPDTIVVRDIEGRTVLAGADPADPAGAGRPGDRGGGGTDDEARFGTASAQDRAVLDELIARCVAGERAPTPVVTTGRLPDGGVRTYETRARPVFDPSGHVTGTVTVSRDVTARVHLEQSLRRATAEAERASEAKSEFLSRMSHELRTPLNAILGFAQLLELDELPPTQASSVDQIERAGHHLLSLINEVLDIARIEAGHLVLSTESVEVDDVLDEVTTLLSPVAETNGIALSVDVDGARSLRVGADRQRLLQVLLNLGSNALKYNGRGGAVAFRTGPGTEGTVRFEVHDTGPGIPLEQQDELFVPFSRLGAERSAVEGTGVGLALSKQLVEAMGGTIGVHSRPGHGSTFWVELDTVENVAAEPGAPSSERPGPPPVRARSGVAPPAVAAPPGTGRPGPAPAHNGHHRPPARSAATDRDESSEPSGAQAGEGPPSVVVLQIEDNPSNASLVEQILAKRPGVRLVSAAEAASGLELARRHHPDLVLLDLHLPDLAGDVLLHRLKAVPELADTKVVVVSADATPGRIRGMLDLGVEGYLTKPVDVEALLRLVDHEIGVRQGEPR
ncbi:MAG TPA: ATP-binding protein [Acidimicrobiales bacterium]|nr:ATP-binding protein [Acidimicrobiales bacterium]